MRAAATSALAALPLVLAAVPSAAQQRTYANPIDIDYRYNFEQQNQGISYRSGADPVIPGHVGAGRRAQARGALMLQLFREAGGIDAVLFQKVEKADCEALRADERHNDTPNDHPIYWAGI